MVPAEVPYESHVVSVHGPRGGSGAHNFGYRQVLSLWQVWGAVSAWHGRPAVWGTMDRTGFGTHEPTPVETVGAGPTRPWCRLLPTCLVRMRAAHRRGLRNGRQVTDADLGGGRLSARRPGGSPDPVQAVDSTYQPTL